MMGSMISALMLFLGLHLTSVLSAQEKLMLTSSSQCVCSGDILTYECTVESDVNIVSTIWTGSVFDCPASENELVLIHSMRRFTETQGCNNGAITGRGISVVGNSFTSQISVTVDPTLDGKYVICSYNNDSSFTIVGNSSIQLTTDSFLPPTDVSVSLTDVLTELLRLTFKWNPVAPECTAIRYITDFDCGSCPNITANSEVVCTDIVIQETQCTFKVQAQVCDSISGNTTTMIHLSQRVPEVLQVKIIPTYSFETGYLTKLKMMIIYEELENFNVILNEGVNLNPTSYSIMFSAGREFMPCGSTNISASSCVMGICHLIFNISSSSCHTPILSDVMNVNVFASNVLGSGQPYNTTIDLNNVILEVKFNAEYTQVTCKFLSWIHIENNRLNCSIVFSTLDNNSQTFFITDTSETDIVIINISTAANSIFPNVKYRFSMSATYGNSTTVVDGSFTINQASSPFTIGGLVFGAVVGAMGAMLIIIIIISIIISILAFVFGKRKGSNISINFIDNTSSMSHINTERNVAYESVFSATHHTSRNV